MTGAVPISPRRYVVRQLKARPARSTLTVAGVAIAVAFFVLFGSMSAGLSSFIDEELDKPRPVNIYLESGSPTPFDSADLLLISAITLVSQENSGIQHHTTSRVQLPVTSRTDDGTVWLWGIDAVEDGRFFTPPYDAGAPLEWGRHLNATEDMDDMADLTCVLGSTAHRELFPGATEGSIISVGADASVDPWWMASATSYPYEGKEEVTAPPRGPFNARVVGLLEPGQGEELDHGIFVPIKPLLLRLDQWDTRTDPVNVYYPQAIITIEDGTRVDILDMEADLAAALPGISGSDDAWNAEAFQDAYGSASRALEGWLMVVTGVMVVMLVAGVSDTTLVAVTGRRREIATLRAVGIGRRRVSRLVVLEVLLLAVVGLVIGLAVGTGLSLLFGSLHESSGGTGIFLAPVALQSWVLVGATVLALGSAALAAAYPASRAAGQSPTEALRYE